MSLTGPVCILVPYLVGAVPFGLLLSRGSGIDIRTQGSGNIGATNVACLLGKKKGVLTLALDIVKGWAPMVLAAPLVQGEPRRDLIIALCARPRCSATCFPCT